MDSPQHLIKIPACGMDYPHTVAFAKHLFHELSPSTGELLILGHPVRSFITVKQKRPRIILLNYFLKEHNRGSSLSLRAGIHRNIIIRNLSFGLHLACFALRRGSDRKPGAYAVKAVKETSNRPYFLAFLICEPFRNK